MTTSISTFLQQLIDEANEAIQQSQTTIKEKLLYVYNAAIEEGYTSRQARKIMLAKIVNVSDSYIRKILPMEAKNPNLIRYRYKRALLVAPILQETETNVEIPTRKETVVEVQPEEEEEQEPLAPFTATDDFLKTENELQLTVQLLREERAKTEELYEKLELKEQEHEAKEASFQDKINDLDSLADKLSYQLQEKSKQLTNMTTQMDGTIEEAKPEKNYSIEADIKYQGKELPIVVRVYVSGKKIGWIDREVYKARYGKEPQD